MKKIWLLAVLAILFCMTQTALAIRPAVVGDVVHKGGGVYDVRAYGAKGDGVTDDYTAINNAATAANGNTLEFKSGTYKIGTNISLDEDVLFYNGAMLSIDTGVTVTFTGTVDAGIYTIFPGLGTASISAGVCDAVYPQWWGAIGDGVNDDTSAFDSAMTAAQAVGKMKIPSGLYTITSPLQNFPAGVFAYANSGYIIEGCGTETVINYTGTTGYAFEIDSNDPADQFTPVGVTIRDLKIRAVFIPDADSGGAFLVVGSFVNLERITTRYMDDATAVHVRSRIIPVTESGMTNDTNRDFTTTGAGVSEKYAVKFTSSARAASLKDVIVRLGITGAPAGTVHAEIWTDVAGSPGAQVTGGDSDLITINTISSAADGEDVNLDFGDIGSRPLISNSTNYWLVISTAGYTYVNGVTELRLRVEVGGGAANTFATYDFGGASWSTSADGANYTANCRYGQALGVNITGWGLQSESRIGRAFWVEDSCYLNITNSFASCVEGIRSEYGYVEAHNVYLFTTGVPVYATGWTTMFGGVIEGPPAYPSYFGGMAHTHRLIGVNNSIAPVTWESGTYLIQEACAKDFWWSDYADVVPDQWRYKVIPAQADSARWDTSGQTFTADVDALNGNASQLNAQNEYIHVTWSATKNYAFLPRGTYKATMWMKDTAQVANDMIVRSDFYDGAWNTDFENTFTLTADYKPYTLLMRLDATQNADITYQKRIWLRKSTATANTISVSHMVIEYIGPDIVGDQNVIAMSTDRSNADQARESQIEFWGSKADGYQSALAQIVGRHEGAVDDYKGEIDFKINSGGETYDTLTTGMTLSSDGLTIVNPIDEFSTDGTLAGNSDTALPSEQAVKTYVDGAVSATLTEEEVEDFVGGMLGGTNTRLTITYQDGTNDIDFVVDDMNDDVPDAGDFGAAADLDLNGEVANDSHDHTTTTVSGLDVSADTNLAVTAPIVLTDDTISIVSPDQVVTVAKAGAEYTTVQGAIDSIGDNASNKPYTVLIYPGTYTEDIVMEDYVSLMGVGDFGTVVIAGTNSAPLVTFDADTSISGIYNLTLYLAPTIDAQSVVTMSNGTHYLTEVSILVASATNDIEANMVAQTGGTMYYTTCWFNYDMDGSTDASVKTHSLIEISGTSIYHFNGANGFDVDIADEDDTLVVINENVSGTITTAIIKNARFDVHMSHTDYDGLSGILYLHGTGTDKRIENNHFHFESSGTNGDTGYIIYMDTTAGGGEAHTTVNRMEITGFTNNYSVNLAAGDDWFSHFDDIVADGGVTGAGTPTYVNSPSDGDLALSGDLTVDGITTFTPSSTQAITGVGGTILANARTVVLDPDGDYTLTSTPHIADGNTGQIVKLTCGNAEANTVTLQDQDTLGGSNVQLLSPDTTRDITGKITVMLWFDGTDWIEYGGGGGGATLTEEQVEDYVGGMLGGTQTGITVTYQDGTNDIDFVVTGGGSLTRYIELDVTQFITKGDGADNNGVASIDWDTTNFRSFQRWETMASGQDMNLYTEFFIPGDFTSFGANAFNIDVRTDSNAQITTFAVTMYTNADGVDAGISAVDITPNADNVWQTKQDTPTEAYSAGQRAKLMIRIVGAVATLEFDIARIFLVYTASN